MNMHTITPKSRSNALRAAYALLLAAGITSLFPGGTEAQISFAAEGRAGVTFPQGDLSDAGAESGLALGAELQATFRPNLTAYLGFQRHAFNCDGVCPLGSSPTSTGIGAGLKYIFHSPGDAHLWGRGGLIANVLDTDNGSSDREIGLELGFGVDMPIAPRLSLVPNVGFLTHDAGSGFTASFVTLGVGIHYHLN